MYYKVYILLFIALLSVSTSPIVARIIDTEGPAIAFWRMSIAAFVLWLYSIFDTSIKFQDKKNYKRTIYAGILLGLHFALFFTAIDFTSIAHATFLGTLAPFFILIIEIVVLKRKFSKSTLIGLGSALLGAIIISFKNFDVATSSTAGNLMAIACSICIALSFLFADKVRKKESTLIYTRTLYLSAAITLVPITLFIAYYNNPNSIGDYLLNYSLEDYYGLIFLGIVPTILGHNSIYYAVKYVPPSIASAFPLGEPVIATIFAYFLGLYGFTKFSGETIGSEIYLGGTLTIIGLLLITLNKNK